MARKIKRFFVFLFFSIFFALLSGRIGDVKRVGKKQEVSGLLRDKKAFWPTLGKKFKWSLNTARAECYYGDECDD
ncbi:MAG: hypothetical protein IKS41_02455, partial [Alphaproteobacteria bacterium]|nr:hypothetical protein [Alphaproteobacteria bacterium]